MDANLRLSKPGRSAVCRQRHQPTLHFRLVHDLQPTARGDYRQMMRPRPDTADVLVVGLGPVGAALAGLLGKRGIDVLVLERDDEVFPLPRAAHVDHTGLRTWQELDLLDRLLPAMQANLGL